MELRLHYMLSSVPNTGQFEIQTATIQVKILWGWLGHGRDGED
jgi:hypothetical protein